MEPFLTEGFANPSGMHAAARAAKSALEVAREQVAEICGAAPAEIVFTGGGSESDNLAVKGAAWAARDSVRRRRCRHHCHRAQGGARIAAPGSSGRASGSPGSAPTRGGTLDLDALAAALDDRTAVVSVMLVNNETGIVQPLAEVVELVRDPGAAGGDPHRRGAGPPVARRSGRPPRASTWCRSRPTSSAARRASGALVVRDGVELVPLVDGGGHEGERRAGTQNVAGHRRPRRGVALATDEQRAAERHADRGAARPARRPGSRRGAGSARERRPRAAGFPESSLRVPRRRLGDAARRARPARRLRGVGFGVLVGRDRAVARVARDGHRARVARASVRFSLGHASTDADVDAALAVVPGAVQRLLGAAA